jgi:hypothetical protein
MFAKTILHTWVFDLVCCTIIATLIYAMMPAEQGSFFQQNISWFLIPGIALYVQLNGSFLFGWGSGNIGDFLIIVMSSAVAWSFPIFLLSEEFRGCGSVKGG